MSDIENPGYFAVIPASVRYDKGLCPNAKLLYGEIAALSNKEGYCWASNKYFADLYGVEVGTVSSWVASLVEKGYLKSEVEQNFRRKLWIAEGGFGKIRRGIQEKPEGDTEKTAGGDPEKPEHNNTRENRKENNATAFKAVTDIFWEKYRKKVGEKPTWKVQFRDMASRLLKASSLETIAASMDEYFNDSWYSKQGWDFGVFCSQFDKLRSRVKVKPPAEQVIHLVPDGNGGLVKRLGPRTVIDDS